MRACAGAALITIVTRVSQEGRQVFGVVETHSTVM